MRKYSTEWLSINRMSHVTHAASLRVGYFQTLNRWQAAAGLAYVTPNTIMIVGRASLSPRYPIQQFHDRHDHVRFTPESKALIPTAVQHAQCLRH